MTVPPSEEIDTPLDPLTVSAVAVTAYLIANVLHEGIGHAGACLLTGCHPRMLTTAYFDGDKTGVSEGAVRFIAAAGTLVNLAAGALFFRRLRQSRSASGSVRYFLWCSMAINLLVGAGYPLFSGVLGIGDWITVIGGLKPAGLWRLGLAIAGIVLYGAAARFCLRELGRLTGSGDRLGVERAVQLTVRPYLIGSTAATLGALLNPLGMRFVATSAAAHFGGTSALAWIAQRLDTPGFPPAEGQPIQIRRSAGWVTIAAMLLALHVAVLGRGIRF